MPPPTVELVGGPKDGAVLTGQFEHPAIGGPHRDTWGGQYVRTELHTKAGATVYQWTPNSVES